MSGVLDPRLDEAPCGYVSVTDDGYIEVANRTLAEMLDMKPGGIEGTHIDQLLTASSRIFYQTHVFPMLKLQGRVQEICLALRCANEVELPVLLNARRKAVQDRFMTDWIVLSMRRRNEYENELVRAREAAEHAAAQAPRFASGLGGLVPVRAGSGKSAMGLVLTSAETPVIAGAANGEPLAQAPRLDGVRVLVVDSDPEMREWLHGVLSAAGATPHMASSASQALASYLEQAPDILLAELEMEGGDGFALVRRIRDIEEGKPGRTPAIAVTTHVHASDRLRSLAAGFQSHLAKPVEPLELLLAIASFLPFSAKSAHGVRAA